MLLLGLHAEQGPPGPVEVLDVAGHLSGTAVAAAAAPDLDAALDRRDRFVSHHDDGSQVAWAAGVGIDVVRGPWAAVRAPDRHRHHRRRVAAVAHGPGGRRAGHRQHSRRPPVPGLADALPWMSRDVTNLHEVPRRVAVIGGGVVACEATTWLRGLGTEELTVIEPEASLLGRQEPFVGELIGRRFTEWGIEVLTGTPVDRVDRPGRPPPARATATAGRPPSPPVAAPSRWTSSWRRPAGRPTPPTSDWRRSASTWPCPTASCRWTTT